MNHILDSVLERLDSNTLSLTFYHASEEFYKDVIKPKAPCFGTKLYKPHWAVYMWKKYEQAKAYCLYELIRPILIKAKFDPKLKESLQGIIFSPYKDNTKYCINNAFAREYLCNELEGSHAYVYTIKVPLNQFTDLRLGHDRKQDEYTLNGEAKIYRRDKIIFTEKYFNKYLILVSNEEATKIKTERLNNNRLANIPFIDPLWIRMNMKKLV